MRATTIAKSSVFRVRFRTLGILLATAAALLPVSKSAGDQLDDMRNMIGHVCPANPIDYDRIDSNAECNPNGSKSRGCDQRFPAASIEWQVCLAQIHDCRLDIDEKNKIIDAYNLWMHKCRLGKDNSRFLPNVPTAPKSSATPADDASPLARAREAARKMAEDANAKNNSAKVEAKSQYQTLIDELKKEKAKEEAEERAVRQNQEKIRQQLEEENDEKANSNPRVTNAACYNDIQICFSQCKTIHSDLDCTGYCQLGRLGFDQHCYPR
jgi:hypothetical protein